MTDPDPGPSTGARGDAGPTGTSWRATNITLGVLALLLLVASVLMLKDGASATPGDSRAEMLAAEYDTVTEAARKEAQAFLTVDYQDMDPLIAEVLAGSTGEFKKQYDTGKVDLKASAQDSRAVSTGKVVSVGVGDIDDDRAVVLVAADSQVRNKSTQDKAQPRYHRLRLTMVRKGDTWLTSDLQFVG